MSNKKIKKAFEDAANKKGYCFDKDDVNRYEDVFLQEAWEIFMLIDLKELTKDN